MYASKVVEQAQAWLGKKESDGTHREIIDIYNAHKPLARGYKVKYTDSWCATFVSAVAINLGYTDIIPTECSCGKMITKMQSKGIWVENDAYVPSGGDIVFYDWQDSGQGDNTGWADHVGIVEKVENGTITVIEGNYNDEVGRRKIAVNGRYIRGYGVPKYSTEQVETKKSVEEVAKAVINGEYGNGAERKQRLAAEGYDYAEVQAKVNEFLNGKQTAVAVPSVEYYPKYSGTSNSIVDALKSLKIDASYTNRKKIATKNGIKLYIGTAKQNTQMLNLLKQGKLVK